ncbi:MAG: hypothetical protein ABSF09_13460 [Candidatus Bathyarchaeia archaeon]
MDSRRYEGYLLKAKTGEYVLLKDKVVRFRDNPVRWLFQRVNENASLLSIGLTKETRSQLRDFPNGQLVRVTMEPIEKGSSISKDRRGEMMTEIAVQRVDRDKNFYPTAPFFECTVTLTGIMQAPTEERAGELFLESIESDGIGDFYKGKMQVKRGMDQVA